MRHFRNEWAKRSSLVALILSLQSTQTAAQLAPIASNPTVFSAPRQLRLEVTINGAATNYVAPFIWTPPGRLSATRADLEDVGVKAPGHGGLKDEIFIDDIPGIRYRYDEPGQKIDFTLSEAQRATHVYDARAVGDKAPPARTDWGALLNYTLYATTLSNLPTLPKFTGANASLDARAFTPLGVVEQTAIVGDTIASNYDYLRLDSTFTYSDPEAPLTARAGDTISGGLAWTRPVRYGGFQFQRDFSLRSDLVTQPAPAISGSTAVPSTVDVFINDIKTYSQPVGAGPYQITNLPLISNSGAARVVVTDASGRTTETTSPFFSAPTMLARGMTDFSLDAGFARRFYATRSNDYDRHPIGSATFRQGVTDFLTAESHIEGGAGLANAGLGGIASFGPWGSIAAAGAASRFNGAMGYQAYASYDGEFHGYSINMSSQRSFAQYLDLASVTASPPQYCGYGFSSALAFAVDAAATGWDPRPPKALDRVSLGAPLPLGNASASLSFINLVAADRTHSRILAASLSKQLPWNASVYATAFVDFSQRNSLGVYAGLSIPFGADISVSVGASGQAGAGVSTSFDAQKSLQNVDGGYGWHVHDAEGGMAYRDADVSYRSGYGVGEIGAQQYGRAVGGSARLDGAIVAMGDGVFVGNHVDDSFAVVDAGLPGVAVTRDGQPIGVTGPWGKLLVPGLGSYRSNRIDIDPSGLPTNAEAETTEKTIVPANHGGVYLDFGVKKDVRAAIVVLTRKDGTFLPAGTKGRLEGSEESFVVGYDGQAYVKYLTASNAIVAEDGETECRASFPYAPTDGKRTRIGPIPCQ
jgi:outer membrane usher protein